MNTKHVYFIRHGESIGNTERIRQDRATPLTQRGEVQAELLGDRLRAAAVERIISSSFTRAEHTAAIVSRVTGIPISEVSDLFVERRNPSIMYGRPIDHPENAAIWEEIRMNYHIPDWHHSDEENFADLRARAQMALRYLEQTSGTRLVVTTHGLFMKMIFAEVLLGDMLTARMFWDRFVPIKNIENTGIMHLEFTENYHRTGMYWKLVSWNDHAHLEGN